jgi:hypothetical protein
MNVYALEAVQVANRLRKRGQPVIIDMDFFKVG